MAMDTMYVIISIKGISRFVIISEHIQMQCIYIYVHCIIIRTKYT